MTVVHAGRNAWTVYSGERGEYTVSIRNGVWTCTCPDYEHNLSGDQQCKHAQRTRMEIGDLEIPDLGRRTDVEIMAGARVRTRPGGSGKRVMADGGMVSAAETPDETPEGGCPHDHPDCEVGTGKERPVMCWDCFEVSRR